MEATRNKETAAAFIRMAALGKAREAFDAYAAPGFRHHNPYFKGDAETLWAAMDEDAARSPKKAFDVLKVIGDGDLVAIHSRLVAAQGSPVYSVVHIFRFEGDRIAELWDIVQEAPQSPLNENGMF